MENMGSTCCKGRSDKQFLSAASPPTKLSVKRTRPAHSTMFRRCTTAPLHSATGSKPTLEPILEEEELPYPSSQQGPKALVEFV